MNLLYDISVLGLAHYHERARTGIYRVVENIAKGVVASGYYDVHFYASLGNDVESLEYLAAHSLLSSFSKGFISSSKLSGESERYEPSGVIRRFIGKLIPGLAKNICHSPFHPIPEAFIENRNIVKIQTVHDLIPILFPHLFAFNDDQLIKSVISRLGPETFVICMSESTRNDLLSYKKDLDPAKVTVVYSAASDIFFPCKETSTVQAVRDKHGIPQDAKYILSVSTLEPRKNIDHAIRSFTRLVLQEGIDDLYFVLTGTQGWHYDKIFEELGNADAVRDKILLTGFVPDKDLSPLYSGALAFVYPSFYEGFGLPPLEAMQCGTPVITSNTSSLPEVVADAGILVDPQDSDALCQALLNLYRSDTLRNELSNKSLNRAGLFNWGKCVEETIGVYKAAVE